jgi:SAM-dependent methyltransferase
LSSPDIARCCPVCNAAGLVAPFLDASIDLRRLDDFAYAARKTPEFMSRRLVECLVCATVFAPEIPPPDALAQAYAAAAFDAADAERDASASYAAALTPLLDRIGRGPALEIGAGSGAFLQHLAAAGFNPIIGVEPSRAAVDTAPAAVRAMIRLAMFAEGDFATSHFSLVASFQTLEHVAAPQALVASAYRLLRSGGAIALVTHDRTARINRWLGRRSPIIGIEHLQLFCPSALRRLLDRAGFVAVQVEPIANVYRLRYWLRLMPVSRSFKAAVIAGLAALGLDRLRFRLRVGNLLAIGRKP